MKPALPTTPGTVVEVESHDEDGSVLDTERFVRLTPAEVKTQSVNEEDHWLSLTDSMTWPDRNLQRCAVVRVVSRPTGEVLQRIRDEGTQSYVNGVTLTAVPHETLQEASWLSLV